MLYEEPEKYESRLKVFCNYVLHARARTKPLPWRTVLVRVAGTVRVCPAPRAQKDATRDNHGYSYSCTVPYSTVRVAVVVYSYCNVRRRLKAKHLWQARSAPWIQFTVRIRCSIISNAVMFVLISSFLIINMHAVLVLHQVSG